MKFVVPPTDDTAEAFSSSLACSRRVDRGYVSLGVDAVATRVHLMDQLFFDDRPPDRLVALARGVGASSNGRCRSTRRLSSCPTSEPLDVDALAASSIEWTLSKLSRDVNRQLQTAMIMRDYAMIQEFRVAMLRLCQAELRHGAGERSRTRRRARLGSTAMLRQISMLRSAMIFRRIGRHNARSCSSRSPTGSAIERITLGLRVRARHAPPRLRPTTAARGTQRASTTPRPRCSTRYEMLRQLVDNTDELSQMLRGGRRGTGVPDRREPRRRRVPSAEAAHPRRGA